MTADPLAGLGPKVFVTDFDGTMTGVDFYELVLEHVPHVENCWDECVAGKVTHVEALHGLFQQAPRDLAELTRWLPLTKLDPETPAAVRQLRAAGWDIVVVSAGSEWYIQQLLDDVSDDVRIIANPGGYSDEQGLWMGSPPTDALWHCPHFGVDKSKIVQHLLDRGAMVAFAGDGRPDLSAIRRVAAPYRFARGWLSEVLATEGLDHQVFATWSDIAPRLIGA